MISCGLHWGRNQPEHVLIVSHYGKDVYVDGGPHVDSCWYVFLLWWSEESASPTFSQKMRMDNGNRKHTIHFQWI